MTNPRKLQIKLVIRPKAKEICLRVIRPEQADNVVMDVQTATTLRDNLNKMLDRLRKR